MTAATVAPVYYEVVWGPDAGQRQLWIDNRDSAFRLLLQCAAAGIPAGLVVDGVHEAGHRFTDSEEAA